MNVNLPADIIMLLALELDDKTLLDYCRIHSRYNKIICQNDNFWISRIRKYYPSLINAKPLNTGWKDYYDKLKSIVSIYVLKYNQTTFINKQIGDKSINSIKMDDDAVFYCLSSTKSTVTDSKNYNNVTEQWLGETSFDEIIIGLNRPPFRSDTKLWLSIWDFNEMSYSPLSNPVVNVFNTKEEAVSFMVQTYFDNFLAFLELYLDMNHSMRNIGQGEYDIAANELFLPSPFTKEEIYKHFIKHGQLNFGNGEDLELFMIKEITFKDYRGDIFDDQGNLITECIDF